MDEPIQVSFNDVSPVIQKSSKKIYFLIAGIVLVIISLLVLYFTLFNNSSRNNPSDVCASSQVLTIKNDAAPHDIVVNGKSYKITLIYFGFSQGVSSINLRLEGEGITRYVQKVLPVGETFEIPALSIYLRINYADTQGLETVIAILDSNCMDSKRQGVQNSKVECDLSYNCNEPAKLSAIEITKCSIKEGANSNIANIRIGGELTSYWENNPPVVREFTQEIACLANSPEYRVAFASYLRLEASMKVPSVTKEDLKKEESLLLGIITNTSENLTLRAGLINEISRTYYYVGMDSTEIVNLLTALSQVLTEGDEAAFMALAGLNHLPNQRTIQIVNEFIKNNKDNFVNMEKSMSLALTWRVIEKDQQALDISKPLCEKNATYSFCRYLPK